MNEEKKEENTERRGDGDEGNRTPRRSGDDQPRASFNGKLMGVCRDQRPVGQGHQGGIQEAPDESHGGILREREGGGSIEGRALPLDCLTDSGMRPFLV